MKSTNPTNPAPTQPADLSPQARATAEYLKSLGLDPAAAMAPPPSLDTLAPEQADGPRWVGAVNPELEYFRATKANAAEVRSLLAHEGYTVLGDQSVRYDGCSDENDIILVRRREVGVAIEKRRYAQRCARRRGAIKPVRRDGYETSQSVTSRPVRMPADFDQAPNDLT